MIKDLLEFSPLPVPSHPVVPEHFFTEPDPDSDGVKGLVIFYDDLGNEEVLIYERDNKPDIRHPGMIDLPGGGTESGETPFQAFAREVKEEFGIDIAPDHITGAHMYPDLAHPGKHCHFFVARLPKTLADTIAFGNEGKEPMLEGGDKYLARSGNTVCEYVRNQAQLYLAQIIGPLALEVHE